jgi:hypothetical protein
MSDSALLDAALAGVLTVALSLGVPVLLALVRANDPRAEYAALGVLGASVFSGWLWWTAFHELRKKPPPVSA